MGDTIGDASMVDGMMNDTCAVLKIGFLYDNVIMEKFDIVLVDDQTMQVPIDILRLLL
ncbi:hypothetical protein WN51_12402 [Melipona quadrifasciata]|uniref:5'-nucleotidase n=1 Tax=Melipona quadrifasciata TaxID=166423 RepID=A0A0N0BHF3_9HYME|nr:hypothetical protein WN51_12402 [Melipona quadrifasciata]